MVRQSLGPFILRLALFASVLLPHIAQAQVAEISGSLGTSAVIQTISTELKGVINHATERGDYLMSGAAIRMLGAIDAWKDANSELLDQAFSELNRTQQDFFSNARALVYQANTSAANRLETAQQITNHANQIVASLPLNARSYITRQVPRVVDPLVQDTVLLRVWGVNLDHADLEVNLPNGEVRRSLTGPMEAHFHVPLSALDIDSTRMQVHTLHITHRTRAGTRWVFWPRYETVNREVLLATLPKEVASYTLTGTRSFKRREARQITVNAGEFRGTNETITKWAHAPEGWRWDLELPIQVVATGGGESASCSGIDLNGANEHGVKVKARVDRRARCNFGGCTYGDGYKHCGANGTVYRMVDDSAAFETVRGSLGWARDEVITMPADTQSFELRVSTMDGREHVFTNSGEVPLVSIVREGNRLVLRPVLPTDIVR